MQICNRIHTQQKMFCDEFEQKKKQKTFKRIKQYKNTNYTLEKYGSVAQQANWTEQLSVIYSGVFLLAATRHYPSKPVITHGEGGYIKFHAEGSTKNKNFSEWHLICNSVCLLWCDILDTPLYYLSMVNFLHVTLLKVISPSVHFIIFILVFYQNHTCIYSGPSADLHFKSIQIV